MIGFIGLGGMGSRMATRLLQANYPLGVYNRTPEKAQDLVRLGAHVYSAPAELARRADVLLLMLADDAAVEQVMLGPSGVLAGAARSGATVIDMSSVHPDTSRRIASAARLKDVVVLDAPVSGSTPLAEDGSLTMFVGGDRDIYERCRPILDVLARQIFYVGPGGSGTTMKLVVNSLLATGMQALAEALVLGERGGLELETLLDVLEQTTVLATGQKRKLDSARTGQYPVQFPLRLMWKDLVNVLRLAQQHAVPMPATAAAQQAFAIEQARGVEEDFSVVMRTMRELALPGKPTSRDGRAILPRS
jgi:3-hydroxyisobutyrate dehydrogenase-like beta-hydroxyacid dehydrogenase